jgi:hypothetical protein
VTLVMPKVIEGALGIVKVLKSLAAGEIVVESLAGGFGMVAINMVLAGGAVLAMDTMMNNLSSSTDKATEATKKFKTNIGELAAMPPVSPIDKMEAQQKSIESITKQIYEQAAEIGKSKDEVDLMRLAWAGADDAIINTAQSLMRMRDVAENAAKRHTSARWFRSSCSA